MTFGSERGLQIAVGAFAVAAGYLFVQRVFFTLSITVRAALILAVALVMVCWAATPGVREFPAVGMVTVVVVFVGFTAIEFPLPTIALVLAVPVTVIVLVALAHLLHEGHLTVERSTAGYVAFGLFLISATLVGIDTQVGEVEYTATLDDEVTLTDDSNGSVTVRVGTATARNTHVFREPVSFPSTTACLYTGAERLEKSVVYHANRGVFRLSVAGNERLETRMTFTVRRETARTVSGPLPVERDERCPPADDGPPRIVVTDAPPTPGGATG